MAADLIGSEDDDVDALLLVLLGLVVTSWAYVEDLQGRLLAKLLRARSAGMMVLTTTVAASTITTWIRTLLQYPRSQEKITKPPEHVISMLNTIDELRAERNALVHGLWAPGPDPRTALVTSYRMDRVEITKVELVTPDDLHHLIDHIHAVTEELSELVFPPSRQRAKSLGKRKPITPMT